MSTKTTFKRIALVAVAALGLGVLSVAPSSATVSNLGVTVVNGTSTASGGGASDSTTAATFNLTGIIETRDSVTISLVAKSIPSGNTANAWIHNLDSATGTVTTGITVDSMTAVAEAATTGAGLDVLETSAAVRISNSNTSGSYVSANINRNFGVQLESTTALRKAGTYTYTLMIKQYDNSSTVPSKVITQDISIVVSALTAASETPSATKSFAVLTTGASTTVNQVDSAVAAVSTAGTTAGYLSVGVRNASDSTTAVDSVTATITGAGVLCNASSVCGRSFVVAATGDQVFTVQADGTAGVGTISVKTNTTSYAAKTVTFYAKAAKTITAAANKPVIAASATTSVVFAQAVDANGTAWGGTAYIYAASAADALIAGSETPAACTYVPADNVHACSVTGKLAGTANFKVIDASTVALATATSNAVAVKVSTGTPASVKLAFNKSTYAPGEKAQIWVSALDAAGNALPEQTINNIFAAGGISASTAFSAGSDTTTATFADIAGATSATAGTVAGYKIYTVYMPMSSGDLTITATGGTGLAPAGRVAVTATASVVNTSVDAATDAANEATDAANAATDAALAAADAADAATAAAQDASDAVAALSATVAKLVASLKAQITSLTNLVIKIQKKVRA